jgi:hypothetical protein
MAELYHVAGEGANQFLTATPHYGGYDPQITKEVDQKIRHLPVVISYITKMGTKLWLKAGRNDFQLLVVTSGKSRPRAYVMPKTSKGIKEELQTGVLLKAAMAMKGK